MSEPLYIFLMLVSFLLLNYYFASSKNRFLVALGVTLGWAYLARYAGLSLLATMIAALLVLHENWQKRLKSVAILSLSALPWILGWSLRNRIVGGSLTNRTLGWHPITADNWKLGVNTFAEFLVPSRSVRMVINQVPASFEIILILIGAGLLAWVLYTGLPYLFRPARTVRPDVLSLTSALYIIAYMSVLVLTMTLFDPATKFQVRILSPTYVSLLFLLVALGTWLWRKRHTFWKPIISLCILGLLSMFASGQVMSVQDFREGGDAFASEKWFALRQLLRWINSHPMCLCCLMNRVWCIYMPDARAAFCRMKGLGWLRSSKPCWMENWPSYYFG